MKHESTAIPPTTTCDENPLDDWTNDSE